MTRVLTSALLLLVVAAGAYAQPSDTITANPKAARLKRIWSLAGNPAGGGYIGQGCGGVGDLDGDGLSEFAVLNRGVWSIYRGKSPAPDTTAIWHLGSGTSSVAHPIVGDFWGTGHPAIGFSRDTGYINEHSSTTLDLRLWIYRTDSGGISAQPAAILRKTMFPCLEAMGADLDGDGADELIVSYSCYSPEIWIYKGGAGFQVDSPTVVIHDPPATTSPSRYYSVVGDLDGDHHLDLLTGGIYNDGARLKFFWGSDSSFWRWQQPDRTVAFPSDEYPRLGYGITAGDFDGDGATDLAMASPDGPRLFRTGGGGSARTRSYRNDDADMHWKQDIEPVNLGWLNDTTGHYAMLGVIGAKLYGFAGGRYGPDRVYEAYYSAFEDGYNGTPFGSMSAMGDCTGDGWPEFITSNGTYGFNAGVALILAGGPDIPRDGSLGVEAVAGEGHSDAVSVWPNPLGEELHIAWRGDLKRMPHRFVVHDMTGGEVARGEVESWRGEALWRCGGVASGGYVLSVYDGRGSLITSAGLVKAGE